MKRILGLAVSLLVLLAGCRSIEGSSQPNDPLIDTQNQSSSVSENEMTESTEQIRFFGSHQSVNGYGAGNDVGIYLSQPIESGGFRTMYLDFATNHLVPLCTRPECTHVDESCTAYCNTSGGGLSLAVTNDALIRCYLGGSSLETARIVRSDLNGENPKQIAELQSSQRLGTWIAGDNHFVYAIRTTVNPDTTLVQDLIRIDVQTGEVSQIVSLESTSCFLVGARDRQIIVKCFLSAQPTDSSLYDPDASQVFIAINADTGEQTTLASLPIAQNAAYYDGSLISVNTTEQTVSCFDTSDGSTRTVSWQLPNIAQPTKVLPSDFISNMLIVFVVGDDGKDGAYAISIDSGATQELSLLTQYPDTALDEPLAIVAQKDDKLLVAPVIDTVSMKIDVGDGSSVSLPAAHASFAWLSTEDYLNNVERYEQISQ